MYVITKTLMVLVILLVLPATAIPAQTVTQRQKDKNLRYILKKASKLECFDKRANYKTLMIYWFGHRHLTKENFGNETLMGSLETIRNRKKKWPANDIIIYNDSVTAYSEGLNVFCVQKFTHYTEILNYSLKQKPDILFRISGTDAGIYFSKKDNRITVLDFNSKGLAEYGLEEYRDCCWNGLLPFPSNK